MMSSFLNRGQQNSASQHADNQECRESVNINKTLDRSNIAVSSSEEEPELTATSGSVLRQANGSDQTDATQNIPETVSNQTKYRTGILINLFLLD